MTTFCVTGGAGFIGSNIVEALVSRGDQVRVADNLATGRFENLKSVAERIEFIRTDVCETHRMQEIFSGVDVVFHEAAIPSVQRSILDPEQSNQSNVTGTLAVLLAARGARVKRVVLAGSSSVYGETPTLPKVETMPPQPISPYGVMKLVGELYAQMFTKFYGLETVSLRYFNVFGPHQDGSSEYSGVLSKFITAMLDGRVPVVFGDGEQSRDFTFVENAVRANLLAAESSLGVGEVINVATGCRHSLNEVVKVLNRIFGTRVQPRYERPRVGDIRHSQADITRARTMLGYTPTVDLETGLERTVAWHRSQQNRA